MSEVHSEELSACLRVWVRGCTFAAGARAAAMTKAQAPQSAHKTAAALPGKKGGSSKVAGKKR